MDELYDGQVWETPLYAFKVEKMGRDCFRIVIFKKVGDKLDFLTVDFRKTFFLMKLLRQSGALLTNKSIVIK